MSLPNNTFPLVTIALPFYNDSSTIVDAVKSVFAQTYQNWELVIIDDGSTDNGYDLIKNIRDPRVQIIKGEKNEGISYRSNQVVELAKGEYVAKLDADDMMAKNRIEYQIEYLVANPTVDVVDTAMYSLSREAVPDGKRGFEELHKNPKLLVKSAYMLNGAVLAKKEWFKQNKYDGSYFRAEDYELWVRTFEHTNFARIPKPLYFVREGRVSLKNYLNTNKTLRKIYRIYGAKYNSFYTIIKLICYSYIKDWLYILFTKFNMQHLLVRTSRNQPISNDEVLAVTSEIAEIRSIKLPYNVAK